MSRKSHLLTSRYALGDVLSFSSLYRSSIFLFLFLLCTLFTPFPLPWMFDRAFSYRVMIQGVNVSTVDFGGFFGISFGKIASYYTAVRSKGRGVRGKNAPVILGGRWIHILCDRRVDKQVLMSCMHRRAGSLERIFSVHPTTGACPGSVSTRSIASCKSS